jgi:hypothetical protein
MKENLHTPDSLLLPSTNQSQRNLSLTKTCIPLTVLLLPSTTSKERETYHQYISVKEWVESHGHTDE